MFGLPLRLGTESAAAVAVAVGSSSRQDFDFA